MCKFAPANPYQPSYNVTPDGSRFVTGRRVAGNVGEQLIVVEHLFRHLPGPIRPWAHRPRR